MSPLLHTVLFADDTSVFVHGKHNNNLIMTMQIELNKLSCWLRVNKLLINYKKSHSMMFHRTKIIIYVCLYIHDHEIKPVSTTKFLGVFFDEKFQWSDHINYIKNKISKALAIIYKAKKLL